MSDFTLPQTANLPNFALNNNNNLRLGSTGFSQFPDFNKTNTSGIDVGFSGGVNPDVAQPFNLNNIGTDGFTPNGTGSIPDSAGPGFLDPKGGSRFLVPGLEALTGVGNFFLARDQLKLGKKQFKNAKETNVRDFNSQSQVYNTSLENAKRNNLAASGGFDTSTAEGQAAFDQALNDYVTKNSIQSV